VGGGTKVVWVHETDKKEGALPTPRSSRGEDFSFGTGNPEPTYAGWSPSSYGDQGCVVSAREGRKKRKKKPNGFSPGVLYVMEH